MSFNNGCKQFTYDHYQDILALAKQTYAIGPFREYKELAENKKYIILRHDIDFSIDSALIMAALEHNMGIRSTYFILLHSTFYNPLTEDSIKKLSEFVEMGHEIGLHYDPNFAMVQNEVELLTGYLDTKIQVIAKHRPATNKKDIEKPRGLIDAYDPKFTKEIKYISDSAQYWREGCMCHHVGVDDKMQILVHPEWWGEKTLSSDNILTLIKSSINKDVGRRIRTTVEGLRVRREKMVKGLI
jgi:hypothetical protein